jgi:hypothetical protein
MAAGGSTGQHIGSTLRSADCVIASQLFCILLIWPLTMAATGFTTYIAVIYSSLINKVPPRPLHPPYALWPVFM